MDRTVVSGSVADGTVWVFCSDGSVFTMALTAGKWTAGPAVPGTAAASTRVNAGG
jgi:hypothetical protein